MQEFLDTLVPVDTVDGWYLCGPLGMVEELRKVLRSLDVPRDRVHAELFHVGPPPSAVPVPVRSGTEPRLRRPATRRPTAVR